MTDEIFFAFLEGNPLTVISTPGCKFLKTKPLRVNFKMKCLRVSQLTGRREKNGADCATSSLTEISMDLQ